jgi:hypothetical protein
MDFFVLFADVGQLLLLPRRKYTKYIGFYRLHIKSIIFNEVLLFGSALFVRFVWVHGDNVSYLIALKKVGLKMPTV